MEIQEGVDEYDILESPSDNEDLLLLSDENSLDSLERLERIEIIFDPVPDLSFCKNLRKLYLIKNDLRQIPILSTVKNTLQCLSLVGQGITKIENLDDLINLRELYLDNNEITKMEHLENCSKLQKLWLHTNKISTIENIENLVELKEMWLQANYLTTIPNTISYLTNLQVLCLSDNDINSLKAIQPLVNLPSLSELAFADNFFSPAPITQINGYRNYLTHHLTQLQLLDAVPIYTEDRDNVNDLYLQRARQFNFQLELLKKQNKEQLRLLLQKKKGVEQKANSLKKQMLDSMVELERTVTDGRAKVMKEYLLQIQLRQDKKKQLEKIINSIKKNYEQEVERLVDRENHKLQSEDKYFHQLKNQTEKHMEESIFMLSCQFNTNGAVVCYELDSKNPEFRYVKNHFEESMQNLSGDENRIFSIYKIYNSLALKTFERNLKKSSSQALRLYFVGDEKQLRCITKDGFAKLGTKTLIFFENAIQAHNQSANESASVILLCQVIVPTKINAVQSVTYPLDLETLSQRYGNSTVTLLDAPDGRIFLVNEPSICIPEFYISYSQQIHQNTKLGQHLEFFLHNNFSSVFPSLQQLERKVEEEVLFYQYNLWSGDKIDTSAIQQNKEKIQKLENALQSLQHQLYDL